ncbi:MAG: hypothetical protein EXR51_07075 [Dehalococcoidia bacterium]|nr:hypothetical protein [Dehalococcoidia bacterium]
MAKPDESLTAGWVQFAGHNGETIDGYLARPTGSGPYPGVVLIHEAFGLVRHTKEQAVRFAAAGYICLAPDLYTREAFVREGQVDFSDPAQARAVMQAMGGMPDARAIGDLDGAAAVIRQTAHHNGKTGVIGHCSGGRHTLLFACNSKNVHAAVDCYGGRIIVDDPAQLTPNMPVQVIDMVSQLNCPLLGLFGAEDQNPAPAHTAHLEEALKKNGKTFDLKTYDGAGHAFFADYRPSYRQAAAVDAWERTFAWFERYLR